MRLNPWRSPDYGLSFPAMLMDTFSRRCVGRRLGDGMTEVVGWHDFKTRSVMPAVTRPISPRKPRLAYRRIVQKLLAALEGLCNRIHAIHHRRCSGTEQIAFSTGIESIPCKKEPRTSIGERPAAASHGLDAEANAPSRSVIGASRCMVHARRSQRTWIIPSRHRSARGKKRTSRLARGSVSEFCPNALGRSGEQLRCTLLIHQATPESSGTYDSHTN